MAAKEQKVWTMAIVVGEEGTTAKKESTMAVVYEVSWMNQTSAAVAAA